jgi:hypothetical protein
MGAKSAWAEQEEPVESWERTVVETLRAQSDRKIIYRPKPSWTEAKPIPGTTFSPRAQPLIELLGKQCHAVVTHHSNVAVDGLVSGVPAFIKLGAAAPMSLSTSNLAMIEYPYYPLDRYREQWLNDLAYCQWSLKEMSNGACWSHLKEEGLV